MTTASGSTWASRPHPTPPDGPFITLRYPLQRRVYTERENSRKCGSNYESRKHNRGTERRPFLFPFPMQFHFSPETSMHLRENGAGSGRREEGRRLFHLECIRGGFPGTISGGGAWRNNELQMRAADQWPLPSDSPSQRLKRLPRLFLFPRIVSLRRWERRYRQLPAFRRRHARSANFRRLVYFAMGFRANIGFRLIGSRRKPSLTTSIGVYFLLSLNEMSLVALFADCRASLRGTRR